MGEATLGFAKEALAVVERLDSRLQGLEEGQFAPSGSIHLSCVRAYLETTDVLVRVKRFSPGLSEADLEEIQAALQGPVD